MIHCGEPALDLYHGLLHTWMVPFAKPEKRSFQIYWKHQLYIYIPGDSVWIIDLISFYNALSDHYLSVSIIRSGNQKIPKQWKTFLADGINKTQMVEFLFMKFKTLVYATIIAMHWIYFAHEDSLKYTSVDNIVVLNLTPEQVRVQGEADTYVVVASWICIICLKHKHCHKLKWKWYGRASKFLSDTHKYQSVSVYWDKCLLMFCWRKSCYAKAWITRLQGFVSFALFQQL